MIFNLKNPVCLNKGDNFDISEINIFLYLFDWHLYNTKFNSKP